MAIVLKQEIGEAERSWEGFLKRRKDVTAQMEMAKCNGCDGCGGRCIEGFTVTRAEFAAIQGYLGTLPPEEVARVAAQEKVIAWPGAEETGATVTVCRYRDRENDRCLVYPARPTICRLFGHTHWLPCPIEKVKQIPEGTVKLFQEYGNFSRKTFADWEVETKQEQESSCLMP